MADDGKATSTGEGGIIEVECNVLVEFGSALNVAGDCCVNAAFRLRNARTESERAAIRAELRGFLRRTIGAATLAFAVLDDAVGDVKGPP